MSTQTWLRDVGRMLDAMGVSYTLEYGRKHGKLWINKDGKRGLITLAMSPSDPNTIHAVRKSVKRQLGLVHKS